MVKFIRKWWFLISAFALLGGSVAAWGVRVDTMLDMEEKYVPRKEIMLRFDHVDYQQSETNAKLEAIMYELGVDDVSVQPPLASQP
jgi:hypothetical protein